MIGSSNGNGGGKDGVFQRKNRANAGKLERIAPPQKSLPILIFFFFEVLVPYKSRKLAAQSLFSHYLVKSRIGFADPWPCSGSQKKTPKDDKG